MTQEEYEGYVNRLRSESRFSLPQQDDGMRILIALTGKELHQMWVETCLWSSVGFERDWEKLHPHMRAKWEELAKILNSKYEPK